MAISKERKTELVTQYVEQLKRSQGIILADYRGLNVNQMSNIRRTMRSIGAKFQVVKNNLLALALEQVGLSLPEEWLEGPVAVSFCDDVPPVAKALKEAAREMETLHIKGGLLGRSVLAGAEVQAIAELPSREALLAQVLGTINAPARQIAGAVASGIRQVLNVVQAYADKLESGGAGGGLETVAEAA